MSTETSLITISNPELDNSAGGTIGTAIDNVFGAPSRFRNGYAYGTQFIGPLYDKGPIASRVEGVASGIEAVFNPGSTRNFVGEDIRKQGSSWGK